MKETAAVHSLFIIDPDLNNCLSMTCPMNVGRNFAKILRVIYALQTVDAQDVATARQLAAGRFDDHPEGG